MPPCYSIDSDWTMQTCTIIFRVFDEWHMVDNNWLIKYKND